MLWIWNGIFCQLIYPRIQSRILRLQNEAIRNQSVENAGVAFVKGANERNSFFEKKKL